MRPEGNRSSRGPQAPEAEEVPGGRPPGSGDVQTSVERRRSPRAPLVVHVRYRTVDALFAEFSRNINEGGIFIETPAPAGLGAQVALEFELPGQTEPLLAWGRVTRLEAGGPRPGMALEFERLDPSAQRRINECVRQLRALG